MQTRSTSTGLSKGSVVWRKLIQDGVLHPNTYDSDIVELVEAQLSAGADIPSRMNAAGWTARDLLRTISPALNSFVGLMRDLLALYSQIEAKQATDENLIVLYEFEEGDVFDQSLESFRVAIETAEEALRARGRLKIPEDRWRWPTGLQEEYRKEIHEMRIWDGKDWDFTLPPPPTSEIPLVAQGIAKVYEVLVAECEAMRQFAPTMNSARERQHGQSRTPDSLSNIFIDFTDYFPEFSILRLTRDAEHLDTQPAEQIEKWSAEVDEWCASFWDEEVCDIGSALQSALSLPSWGKRHELYSAWIVCPIAKALRDHELQFQVIDGQLKFPFKATQIASFKDDKGIVELWSEVRSEASGEMAHGRKNAIQPDYRFVRPSNASVGTEMVIEVKQYRKASGSNHGRTARDYARALPHAQVRIVAHGPVGRTAANYLNNHDRQRVVFYESVRSLGSPHSRALMEDIQIAFPGPIVLRKFDLEWVEVWEIELLAGDAAVQVELSTIGSLRGKLTPSSGENEVYASIVCHPSRNHTISEASPSITLLYSNGASRSFIPSEGNDGRQWHIGTLLNGSFEPSSESLEAIF